MVSAEDVAGTCERLSGGGMLVWLTGGWGIDALLGEQTRDHKDLDLLVLLDDVQRMRDSLARDGYGLKELWPENAWAIDGHGVETPTAFVLWDHHGRELDVHALRLDDRGDGIPAWMNDEGIVFPKEDLAGEGTIAGHAVRCISPGMQMRCHRGYDLPASQARDLERLCERFGLLEPKSLRPDGPPS